MSATFFLLPPRGVLADRLADCLHGLLPGLDWDLSARQRLIDHLIDAVVAHEGVFLVLREELPAGCGVEEALIDGYGAEPGDEIVEVRATGFAGPFLSRRWRIGEPLGRAA